MARAKGPPKSVDAYIAGFPADVRARLAKVRKTIQKAAPAAEETISYGMPSYFLHGGLLSFGAYKKHIGLYPAPSGSARFNAKLSAYRAEKSTVRFPFDEDLPLDLIREIVKLRIKDNLKRTRERAKAKAS